MDEPTSSLTLREVDTLIEVVKGLKAKQISIVYISHKLEEIMRIADRITVLRDGELIKTLKKDETNIDELVSLMVGRELARKVEREFITDHANRKTVLEVENLSDGKLLKDISFKLYEGEVLGFFGLVGSGRTEMIQCVFGADPKVTGSIKLYGKPCPMRSCADAIRSHMALIPEGRKTQGLFLRMSTKNNMTIAFLDRLKSAIGFLNGKQEKSVAENYITQMQIKTPSVFQNIENLSGGNQQKTIIARWLMNEPGILFMDEPTQGIDVRTKFDIYRIITDLASQNVSVVLISSEMNELIANCDRLLVLCEGRITAEILNHDADQENIMRAATMLM